MKNFITKPIPVTKPEPVRVTRPWGSFSQYAHNREVTVSLMAVGPGKRLSLQSHTARGELWIALDPGAIIQVGDTIHRPSPGEEIWIPAGTRHRLSSTTGTVRVLEVAFGNWQQEDITRYEDDFDRPSQGE